MQPMHATLLLTVNLQPDEHSTLAQTASEHKTSSIRAKHACTCLTAQVQTVTADPAV